MIIDHDHFLSYQSSTWKIGRLDDENFNFWVKDWFVDFPKQDQIYIHSFPDHGEHIKKTISFCQEHDNEFHIIILSGQSIPLDDLVSYVNSKSKVYVVNDYNYSSDRFFPIINSHRTFGKGYVNKVNYTPWKNREFLISSLSSRFEPHRWIITGELNRLKRSDIIFSFHNAYPKSYDIDHFIQSAKYICNFEVSDTLKESVKDLIMRAPIIPEGMHNPRPNGKKTKNSYLYDQCELGVYINSKINLTMEGQFVDTGYGCNITEKTLKCLASGCFPIHVGQSGFYKFLSHMGFNFNTDIDLSFDSLSGDCRKQKLESIINLIKKISASESLENLSKKNYDWFHNHWYDYCEKINQPVLNKLKSKVYEQI